MLRKVGFEEEGRLKGAVSKFGKTCDLIVFGQVRAGLEVTTDAPTEADD